MRHRSWLTGKSAEVLGEALQTGLVSPGRGKDQALSINIIENVTILLAPPAGRFVNPDRRHLDMRLSGACLPDMMLDHPPQSPMRHANQAARGEHRHRRCELERQGFEQECEATALTRLWHGNLRDPFATRTRHARHFCVPVRLVLEKIRMPPKTRHAVVDRLGRSSTGRAGVPARAQRHWKIDPASSLLEVDLLDLPWSNQPQSLGEEHLDHDASQLQRKAAIVLLADGGHLLLPALRKRPRGGGVSTGNDIDPFNYVRALTSNQCRRAP